MTTRFPRRFLFALLLLTAAPTWAAISSSMIFEVRQGGSNNNSGCFKEGATGTDLSQSATQSYGASDLVIDGTTNTKVTSASHNFVSTDVGNCLRISSGTGFTAGIFEIVSVASNAATLDRSAGTLSSTGGVFHVGGALATLAELNTRMCSGCRAYVKADATYTVTSLTNFNYSNSGASWIAGYTSTRGDGGKATVQASSSVGDYIIGLSVGGSFWFRNFILDVNSQGSTKCLLLNAIRAAAQNIECENLGGGNAPVVWNSSSNRCYYCYVHTGTIASGQPGFFLGNNGGLCEHCTVSSITSNGAVGFALGSADPSACLYCTVDSLTGTTTDAFQFTATASYTLDHCVVYNVTRDAIRITTNLAAPTITNCVLSTALNGINNTSTAFRADDVLNDYNFTYNMSGSVITGITAGAHSVTLSVDPFQAASSHDFRLNNKATGGGAVRAHGYPSTLPGVTGTFYPDAGVAQHQDPKFLR